MRMSFWGALAIGLILGACAQEGTLIVQVRTDLVPQRGFAIARTSLTPLAGGEPQVIDFGATDARAWGRGVRVAEIPGLPAGAYRARVSLRDDAGATVVERPVRFEIDDGLRVITVLLTRSCEGVMCPLSGDDPSASACLAGRCVPEDCVEERPDMCGPPAECTSGADCTPTGVMCAVAECTPSGTCFELLDHDGCGTDEVCDPVLGCMPIGACPDLDGDGICDADDPDTDGDGSLNTSDCDPLDPNTYPGAPELCDRRDNDCSSGGGSTVDAGSLFVSADGSGDFTSIQAAVDVALGTGQTVYVAAGTYLESTIIIDGGSPLAILGGREPCDFERSASATMIFAPIIGFDVLGGADVTLEDLEVTGRTDDRSPILAVGLQTMSSTLLARRVTFRTDPITTSGGATLALGISGGTVTLEDVSALPGAATGSSSALVAQGTSLSVEGGLYRAEMAPDASGFRLGSIAGGSHVIDGARIDVSGTDTATGVRLDGGTLELADCVIQASGPNGATAFDVGSDARGRVYHSFLLASADAGDGASARWSGVSPTGLAVNSILRAESMTGESMGIDLRGASGVSILGNDITVIGPSGTYVYSALGALSIAQLESMCLPAVTECTGASGNASVGCALDSGANLITSACMNAGVVPPAGAPPGLLDTDYQGDPRPTGAYDVGPDET